MRQRSENDNHRNHMYDSRVQVRDWVFWEVKQADHKICNNRRCALRRRLIRTAAVETEDYRRPVVNLVRSPILFLVFLQMVVWNNR